jgi:acyl-CoA synthetase (AMP-forming)/AMP-acid ligase II
LDSRITGSSIADTASPTRAVGRQPLSQLPIGDMLTATTRSYANRPCFVSPDGTVLTYSEVNRRVNRLARALTATGLVPGDRLAIVAVDSPEHVELVLACLKIGVVYCDLNYRLRPSELANIVNRAAPRMIVHSTRYHELVDGIAAGLGDRPLLVDLESGGARDLDVPTLAAAVTDASDLDAVPYGEDIVSIAFTSGTTGLPKGVLHSERYLRSMVASGIREVRLRPCSLRYNGPPLFHIAGIGTAFYGIATGAATLILPQFDAVTVLDWMQNRALNDVFLVPTMLSSILELPNVGESDYPHLRAIIYGAAPMTPTLLRRIMDLFDCEMYNVFGAGTEAGGQASLYPEDHLDALNGKPHLLESIGRVIPGVDLKLVDDDLREVPPGEPGEMLVRSQTVMSGYLDQPELTKQVVVNGWVRTGDVASMDDDGYLYLASRKADMIIRGGENVYPVEIESVLVECEAIVEVAVIGRPDAHWGEIVVAVVVARDGAVIDVPAVLEHCRSRLATYKVPERIVVLEQLPKNATGKIQKHLIGALLEESAPS